MTLKSKPRSTFGLWRCWDARRGSRFRIGAASTETQCRRAGASALVENKIRSIRPSGKLLLQTGPADSAIHSQTTALIVIPPGFGINGFFDQTKPITFLWYDLLRYNLLLYLTDPTLVRAWWRLRRHVSESFLLTVTPQCRIIPENGFQLSEISRRRQRRPAYIDGVERGMRCARTDTQCEIEQSLARCWPDMNVVANDLAVPDRRPRHRLAGHEPA